MDGNDSTDNVVGSDSGWIEYTPTAPANLDGAWGRLDAGDLPGFARHLGDWAITLASDAFLASKRHELVFLVIGADRNIEVLTDYDVVEALRRQNITEEQLEQAGFDVKDLLSKAVRCAVQALNACAIVHISEAWMTQLELNPADALRHMDVLRRFYANKLSVSELPDELREEVLMVRVETSDGGSVLIKRRICRDGDNVTLSDVRALAGAKSDEDAPTGRFSNMWRQDTDDAGEVQAVCLRADKKTSEDVWSEEPE